MTSKHFLKPPEMFLGLPAYPQGQTKHSVLIAGANGITGSQLVATLRESPDRWDTIYALSRKTPANPIGGSVNYLTIDLLSSPEEIAAQLRATKPIDFVFFAAYIQPPPMPGEALWSDTAETERVNMLLLSNLLSALVISERVPKRFILQTGAKHYGVHIGPTLSPMEESDPRYLRKANFYFPQEDLLWKWAAENQVSWNVTRPGFIIGAVPETAMSIALGLALYASVQKELGKPLEFYGDGAAWAIDKQVTNAHLISYHAEWLLLTPGTENEILNVADGGQFSYGKLWPILAALFGVDYQVPEEDSKAYQTITMPEANPPRGFGPAGEFKVRATYDAWSVLPEVKEKWAEIKSKYGLQHRTDPFENHQDVFGLLDGELLGNWGRSISMNKNRKLGWQGFVDSYDSFVATFENLAKLKMIPPIEHTSPLRVQYVGY
ncbi:NAD(P)-binding protein [Thozetella sp. PMI_491]|nr:NAD(P)-binding protein [Thozetella sp. PMI_491]